MRFSVQFSIRALLWLIAVVAVLCLMARWLLSLPDGEGLSVILAAGIGLLVGVVVCCVTRYVISGNTSVNILLAALVTFAGLWFAAHFGAYIVGVLIGVLAIYQGIDLVNAIAHALDITISSDRCDNRR